jgi:hypothetical protein
MHYIALHWRRLYRGRRLLVADVVNDLAATRSLVLPVVMKIVRSPLQLRHFV